MNPDTIAGTILIITAVAGVFAVPLIIDMVITRRERKKRAKAFGIYLEYLRRKYDV